MTTKEYNNCVELYSDSLYRFILKNLRNEADSEDIVQNAFEILWKNIGNVMMEKAKSFLFSVAHKNMIDFIRKNNRIEHAEEFAEDAAISYAKPASELKDLLNYGLNMLSEIQKSVLLLRDYEGYAYDEIATITELSESQVKVYIYRARQKMQQFLVGHDKILQ
ncbi:MAG: RNA polymerase sigma factor [Sphingobacteriales bacterium]|nr:MAG: RNA polymerase sigma factor [Sphingobacteriales bacterium]